MKIFDKIIPEEGWEDNEGFHPGKEPLTPHDESPFMDQYRRDEQRDFSMRVVIGCIVGSFVVAVLFMLTEVVKHFCK